MARNVVECYFNRLKQFRRLASRYDKRAHRFNAYLQLACAHVCYRGHALNPNRRLVVMVGAAGLTHMAAEVLYSPADFRLLPRGSRRFSRALWAR